MTPLRITINACTVRVAYALAACKLTSAALGKTIDLSGEFGFSVRWDRELGSGYSRVALADDLAVTMFSSGDRAAAQSLYPIEPSYGLLAELIARDDRKPRSLHLVWSNHDYDLGGGTTAETTTKELLQLLRTAGIHVTEQVADYTPGWGGWRGQHDDILSALFPHPDSADRDRREARDR